MAGSLAKASSAVGVVGALSDQSIIGLGMYDYAYGFPTRPIGLVQYVHVRSTGAAVLRILVHVPLFFTCRIRMTPPFCLGGGESVMWRNFLTC